MYTKGQKLWHYASGGAPPEPHIFLSFRHNRTHCNVAAVNHANLPSLPCHELYDTDRKAYEVYAACLLDCVRHWEHKLEEAKAVLKRTRKEMAEAEATLKEIED